MDHLGISHSLNSKKLSEVTRNMAMRHERSENCTLLRLVRFIKVNGREALEMVKARKDGQMAQTIQEAG